MVVWFFIFFFHLFHSSFLNKAFVFFVYIDSKWVSLIDLLWCAFGKPGLVHVITHWLERVTCYVPSQHQTVGLFQRNSVKLLKTFQKKTTKKLNRPRLQVFSLKEGLTSRWCWDFSFSRFRLIWDIYFLCLPRKTPTAWIFIFFLCILRFCAQVPVSCVEQSFRRISARVLIQIFQFFFLSLPFFIT